MRRRNKRAEQQDDLETQGVANAFLPDESTGAALAAAAALEARVIKLEGQLLSQYSALASYATIAQQAVEIARAESRADLDRAHTTVIGLVDQLRRETQHSGAAEAIADVVGLRSTQIDVMGARVDELAASLEQVIRQQRGLASSVAAVLEHQMTEQGWLASSGSAESLSMR